MEIETSLYKNVSIFFLKKRSIQRIQVRAPCKTKGKKEQLQIIMKKKMRTKFTLTSQRQIQIAQLVNHTSSNHKPCHLSHKHILEFFPKTLTFFKCLSANVQMQTKHHKYCRITRSIKYLFLIVYLNVKSNKCLLSIITG